MLLGWVVAGGKKVCSRHNRILGFTPRPSLRTVLRQVYCSNSSQSCLADLSFALSAGNNVILIARGVTVSLRQRNLNRLSRSDFWKLQAVLIDCMDQEELLPSQI
jgi:hypothetical protein